jgi:hypothetical protein
MEELSRVADIILRQKERLESPTEEHILVIYSQLSGKIQFHRQEVMDMCNRLELNENNISVPYLYTTLVDIQLKCSYLTQLLELFDEFVKSSGHAQIMDENIESVNREIVEIMEGSSREKDNQGSVD